MLELYECCTRLHCSNIRNSAEFAKNSVFFSRKIHQLLRFVFNIVIFSVILINFARLSKKNIYCLDHSCNKLHGSSMNSKTLTARGRGWRNNFYESTQWFSHSGSCEVQNTRVRGHLQSSSIMMQPETAAPLRPRLDRSRTQRPQARNERSTMTFRNMFSHYKY